LHIALNGVAAGSSAAALFFCLLILPHRILAGEKTHLS
jgi:hypothetical protein